MYETDIQTVMTDKILNQEVDNLTVCVTENDNAIVIQCKEEQVDAAYTADEARELANALEQEAEKNWDIVPHPILFYIRDVADFIDGKIEEHEIGGVEQDQIWKLEIN